MLETTKPKQVCMIYDPAFARVVPTDAIFEYVRDRKLEEVESYFDKADMPTIFHVRAIPGSIMTNYVDAQPNEEGKCVAAFRYGVVHVEHLREPPDYKRRVPWQPSDKTRTPGGDIPTLSDADMERFHRCEHTEIGWAVRQYSFLAPYLERAYRPLDTCVQLWTTQRLSNVDASQLEQAPSNEKPSEAPTNNGEK